MSAWWTAGHRVDLTSRRKRDQAPPNIIIHCSTELGRNTKFI